MTHYDIFFDGSAVDNHIPHIPNRRCFGAYVVREFAQDGTWTDTRKVFESPEAHTSNQAEYDALIAALNYLLGMPNYEKHNYRIVGDSSVVVHQTRGDWKINSPKLRARRQKVLDLMQKLDATLETIDRDHNPAGHLLETNNKMRRAIESYGTKFVL